MRYVTMEIVMRYNIQMVHHSDDSTLVATNMHMCTLNAFC